MSRKLVNGRPSIRGGAWRTPSPYLKRNLTLLAEGIDRRWGVVVDLGCGNGRNSEFLAKKGFRRIHSYDMLDDYGEALVIGRDRVPLVACGVSLILANYLLMFLGKRELENALTEIKRIAVPGCKLVVELYNAKESRTPTKDKMLRLQADIVRRLGWTEIKSSRGRFIVRNDC